MSPLVHACGRRELACTPTALPPAQAHVEAWAKEWELGAAEERALLLAAADAMRASKKKKAGPADGYRLTLKALASFEVIGRPRSSSRTALKTELN